MATYSDGVEAEIGDLVSRADDNRVNARTYSVGVVDGDRIDIADTRRPYRNQRAARYRLAEWDKRAVAARAAAHAAARGGSR